jgi:hypothetical protein
VKKEVLLQQVNDELQIRTTVVAEEQEALLTTIHIFKQNNIHSYHHSDSVKKLTETRQKHSQTQSAPGCAALFARFVLDGLRFRVSQIHPQK